MTSHTAALPPYYAHWVLQAGCIVDSTYNSRDCWGKEHRAFEGKVEAWECICPVLKPAWANWRRRATYSHPHTSLSLWAHTSCSQSHLAGVSGSCSAHSMCPYAGKVRIFLPDLVNSHSWKCQSLLFLARSILSLFQQKEVHLGEVEKEF